MSSTGMHSCSVCGDSQYRRRPDHPDDEVVECASCRSPLRLSWLSSNWTSVDRDQ